MVINEMVLQKKFKEDTHSQTSYGNRWIVHMSMFWGFLGLLFATAWNYMVKDLILDRAYESVPIYDPIRLIGIISGLALVYGASFSLYYRFTKPTAYYENSSTTDWMFTWLMWLTGVSGFLVTVMVYLTNPPDWAHWTLVIHVIAAIEVLLNEYSLRASCAPPWCISCTTPPGFSFLIYSYCTRIV